MDSTGHVLLAANALYARSGGIGGDASKRPPIYKVIGIILAISSGVFIGISFVIKKVGLLKANVKYNEEAGEGYGYLKNAWWWLGMTLMIIGEICNFVAYAFVDAILVSPSHRTAFDIRLLIRLTRSHRWARLALSLLPSCLPSS
jgi:hypothetical protein